MFCIVHEQKGLSLSNGLCLLTVRFFAALLKEEALVAWDTLAD